MNRRRSRVHEHGEGGREGERGREREMFPKIREEGNYFKGRCCCCVIKRRSSFFFSVMRLISAAFDGRIEKQWIS